jgi:hypothetical protein
MPAPRRLTISFDPDVHRALRRRSADTDRTISDIANDAVRRSLAENDDLAAVASRAREPRRPFAAFVRDMRRRESR